MTMSTALTVGAEMPNQKDDEVAYRIVREYQRMWENRGVFEWHWNEIARRIDPQNRDSFNPLNFRTPGAKRTEDIFDSTAQLALTRFAAILDSLLTPRNQTWHTLVASHPNLKKDREVALWFEQATRTLFKFRYSPHANFAAQNQRNYRSLGAYGTGCMFIDDLDGKPGIRYKNIPLGQIYFAENHQGIVNKAIRRFKLTARQAREKFGEDKLPGQIVAALNVNAESEFDFIHCVEPREDWDLERKDFKGMEYASFYVSLTGQKLCREGGYTTFPYAISRYEQCDDEIYGRSPAMDALPAIKTLNEEKKVMLKLGHRSADPVLLTHDDGIIDGFSMKPGDMNSGAVSAEGKLLVHPLPVGNIQAGKDLMDDERKLIGDVFLINIFQILTENPQMTATEVMERTREKGILLAPTIGRQQSEYLGPMIDRELDILMRQRLLPPMPQQLREARGEYDAVYNSPISRAQRAEEGAGAQRTLEQGMAYFNATQDPSVFDFMDIDKIMRELADINGMPPSWIRGMDQVQAIRAGRARNEQDQKLIQAGPAAAAVMKAGVAAQQAGMGGGK